MTKVKLELLTNSDVVGRICHYVLRYVKANNEYKENYGDNKDSSYIMYLDKKQFVDLYRNNAHTF